MIKKLNLKLFVTISFLLSVFVSAQGGPPCPTCPPTGGGTNPEAAASPIDGYLIALIVVAISMVVYFVRKKQSKVA